ncbi:MAG: fdnH [Phycisphaerales bacterium]|nr:fdnH [Phycisphaerales bacterium]
MTLPLPIVGETNPKLRAAGAYLQHAATEAVTNFPNAFPPQRTEVPQPMDANDRKQIMGFFTDTTLCIGCKACEVACKQWNQLPADGNNFTGHSYDNTGHVSATTWRHVAFKEKMAEETQDGVSTSRWLMMSDVCKHCESAPCQHACPTGAIIYNQFGDVYVQNDICNGCGYCVVACPFGVIGRADTPHDDGHAHKCTLCMDRQEDGLTPACAKSCPTASIQFGPIDDLRAAARQREKDLHGRGNDKAYLYGCDSVGDYGPLNAFFVLEDHPNEYNLPVNPPQPFKGQTKRYLAGLAVGAALTAVGALLFGDTKRGGRRG